MNNQILFLGTFSEVQAQIRGVVSELSELTDEFVQVPPSEKRSR